MTTEIKTLRDWRYSVDIESIAWANLADLQPTLPGGGLLDDMLRAKPAFQRLQLMREKFKQYQKK